MHANSNPMKAAVAILVSGFKEKSISRKKRRIRLPKQEIQEMRVLSLALEGPLEEEMVIHSSILA